MILLIISILVLTIIEYLMIKDFNRFLRITSITTLIAGYLTIISGIIIRLIINNNYGYINISKVTTFLSRQNNNRALILILLGSIELITYIFISVFNKNYFKELFSK